jgi:16S rRNA (cytidine1402-2'-O)-methyltransferase
MSEGRLIICATPIGNLGDVSERLRETLMSADIVYAEDTRRTSKLLNHLGVEVKSRSLFSGNEKSRSAELVEEVAAGKVVVLVSDAGTPVVSDPGAEAVRLARSRGFVVSGIPGPSAVTTALALSGFGGDRFVFEGFLPKKGAERTRRIGFIAAEDRTAVVFVAPHRLAVDVVDLATALGEDRQVAVTRELTKLHEEVWVGSLGAAVERWSGEVKGEFTLVIEGGTTPRLSLEEAVAEASRLVRDGVSTSEAARRVADASGVSRRAVYQELLGIQESS